MVCFKYQLHFRIYLTQYYCLCLKCDLIDKKLVSFIIEFLFMKLYLVSILALLIGTQAFWDVGHMLVSSIAKIRLERDAPEALKNFTDVLESINFLTDNRTHTFVESAVWPDDLNEKKYNMKIWSSWHFSDTPYVVDTVSPVINYTETVFNSIHAVQTASTVLKKNLGNKTVQRALYARYLLHLAGDMHQPLHSVALFNRTYPAGDVGGNRLSVVLLNGTERNFHQFWDSGAFLLQNDTWFLIRPLNEQNRTALHRRAINLIREFGDDVEEQSQIIDPIVWAQQSFITAQQITYPHLAKTNVVDQEYSDLVYRTLKRNIVLAGFRLANFIKDVYGVENVQKWRESNAKPLPVYREHTFTLEERIKKIAQKLWISHKDRHPDCGQIESGAAIEENEQV